LVALSPRLLATAAAAAAAAPDRGWCPSGGSPEALFGERQRDLPLLSGLQKVPVGFNM
jgi:hypothetical protein